MALLLQQKMKLKYYFKFIFAHNFVAKSLKSFKQFYKQKIKSDSTGIHESSNVQWNMEDYSEDDSCSSTSSEATSSDNKVQRPKVDDHSLETILHKDAIYKFVLINLFC